MFSILHYENSSNLDSARRHLAALGRELTRASASTDPRVVSVALGPLKIRGGANRRGGSMLVVDVGVIAENILDRLRRGERIGLNSADVRQVAGSMRVGTWDLERAIDTLVWQGRAVVLGDGLRVARRLRQAA
jgi:hypothetical protein